MTRWIMGEFASMLANTSAEDDARLRERGITSAMGLDVGGVAHAHIRTYEDGTFVPSDETAGHAKAVIVPAWAGPAPSPRRRLSVMPPMIDLVAFYLDDPKRMWRRTGSAALLGEHAATTAELINEPLALYRDPCEWIRQGGDHRGAVVLSWPDASFQLRGLGVLVAESIAHGTEIERRLREPIRRLPKVRVLVAEERAA